MLFSTTFSLLSISALAVAIPTHPPMTRLYPRQNNTAAASTGGEAAAVANGAAVDRAGGILNAEAAAEANQRDDTATRAFSGVSVKAPDGTCLFIDPLSGDFRQNLIPVQTKACDGSANQQFDIITQGKHIDQAGGMLVVSSETQGCLNFDPRRAAGDQVVLFSCGGRADGEGQVTDSQIFAFDGAATTLPLALKNDATICLNPQGGKLNSAACSGDASQDFTIG